MRLGEIGEVNLGKTPHKTQYESKGKYKIVKFRDLTDNRINYYESDRGFVAEDGEVINQLSELQEGDVLVTASAHSSEHIGKKVVYVSNIPKKYGKVFFVGELLCIRVQRNNPQPRTVYYYLISQDGYKSIQNHVRGVHLIASEARQIPIPLPPLPEQQRIVTKIEELFTRLDAGVEALKKIKAQIKRYRQAVLWDAFQGKLTQEWREAHKGELEPASILLERIKEERRKNARGKYRELPPLDTSDLPDLPEGWVWTRLGEVVETVEKTYPKAKPDDEFIYIDIASIDSKQQRIVQPKRYLGKEAPSRARQLVRSGDILFSTVRTYLKNVAVVNELYDGQIASTGFTVIRSYSSIVSKLVFCWVQTEAFLNPLTEIQRGTSYPAVRDSDVFAQSIPFPPLPEQHKIVEEIERRLSVADEIEKTVDQSLKQAGRLRQSILKRAFEGKLVPQDPTDEPAQKLLERIKEEKLKQQAEAQVPKKGKKSMSKQGRLLL
jgi:type I restriction enzyme S subunit